MNYSFAMFPGSFDPITKGHIDIIERAALLYRKLYVVIARNEGKSSLFSAEERKCMAEKALEKLSNVEVLVWDSLIVDFAKKYDVGVIIRGVRALTDFSYEFELAEINRQLCPELEVLFMPTDPRFFLVRSSVVKEMASFGADVREMVPDFVAEKISAKTAKKI